MSFGRWDGGGVIGFLSVPCMLISWQAYGTVNPYLFSSAHDNFSSEMLQERLSGKENRGAHLLMRPF
jgi:hypothetical protein